MELNILGHYNYWVAIMLMMVGLYGCMANRNLVKKLIGLGVFQTSVLLFYISTGWIEGSVAPILTEGKTLYTNPLPHVLMLTAIVVGVATLAVGLAIAVRIQAAYGTVNETEIVKADYADMLAGSSDAIEATPQKASNTKAHGKQAAKPKAETKSQTKATKKPATKKSAAKTGTKKTAKPKGGSK